MENTRQPNAALVRYGPTAVLVGVEYWPGVVACGGDRDYAAAALAFRISWPDSAHDHVGVGWLYLFADSRAMVRAMVGGAGDGNIFFLAAKEFIGVSVSTHSLYSVFTRTYFHVQYVVGLVLCLCQLVHFFHLTVNPLTLHVHRRLAPDRGDDLANLLDAKNCLAESQSICAGLEPGADGSGRGLILLAGEFFCIRYYHDVTALRIVAFKPPPFDEYADYPAGVALFNYRGLGVSDLVRHG